MSASEYLKCPCKECGNNIEFPASSARDTITCPHCGQWTELLVSGQPVEEKESVDLVALAIWIVLPMILLSGIVFFIHKIASTKPEAVSLPVAKLIVPPAPKPKPILTNQPTAVAAQPTNQPPPAPSRPKSHEDLKASEITIQKAKEGKLLYAVGTIKNDSEYQRFGVRIELDLISLQGGKIGVTQDYLSILEPHKEWHFHALVTEPKAVAARVTALKEEQ